MHGAVEDRAKGGGEHFGEPETEGTLQCVGPVYGVTE